MEYHIIVLVLYNNLAQKESKPWKKKDQLQHIQTSLVIKYGHKWWKKRDQIQHIQTMGDQVWTQMTIDGQ